MSLITVGLPVRNGETYLTPMLEGVLTQTYQDFELIISDNASKDRTADICLDFAKRDPRIRYHRQAAVLPPAVNHNFVLQKVGGSYFKWHSHDDVCGPDFLRKCLDALEDDRSAVLAYPRAKIIDSQGCETEDYAYEMRTDDRRPYVRFGSMLRADHRRYAAFEIYGLMRMSALRLVPEMGSYVSADRVLLTRLALLGRFIPLPEYLFFSREHGNRSVRTLPAGINANRKLLRRILGVGALPPLEWWDPTKTGRVNFPEWRLIREYCASIDGASLTPGEKVRCAVETLRWLASDLPKLARDVLIAGESLLTRTPPTVAQASS